MNARPLINRKTKYKKLSPKQIRRKVLLEIFEELNIIYKVIDKFVEDENNEHNLTLQHLQQMKEKTGIILKLSSEIITEKYKEENNADKR